MTTTADYINGIRQSLAALEAAGEEPVPGTEVVTMLRRIDSELGDLVEFAEAGFTWEP